MPREARALNKENFQIIVLPANIAQPLHQDRGGLAWGYEIIDCCRLAQM